MYEPGKTLFEWIGNYFHNKSSYKKKDKNQVNLDSWSQQFLT